MDDFVRSDEDYCCEPSLADGMDFLRDPSPSLENNQDYRQFRDRLRECNSRKATSGACHSALSTALSHLDSLCRFAPTLVASRDDIFLDSTRCFSQFIQRMLPTHWITCLLKHIPLQYVLSSFVSSTLPQLQVPKSRSCVVHKAARDLVFALFDIIQQNKVLRRTVTITDRPNISSCTVVHDTCNTNACSNTSTLPEYYPCVLPDEAATISKPNRSLAHCHAASGVVSPVATQDTGPHPRSPFVPPASAIAATDTPQGSSSKAVHDFRNTNECSNTSTSQEYSPCVLPYEAAIIS